MTYTLGVDPGASGAIACLDAEGDLAWVIDMPHHGGVISPALLLDELRRWEFGLYDEHHSVAWIEDVHSMPHQGVASSFKFGRAHGTVIGVIGGLRIPANYVSPAKWKKAMGLSKDKDASRRLAIETWPKRSYKFARVKDDGRAEAALIALYGHRQRLNISTTTNQHKEQ